MQQKVQRGSQGNENLEEGRTRQSDHEVNGSKQEQQDSGGAEQPGKEKANAKHPGDGNGKETARSPGQSTRSLLRLHPRAWCVSSFRRRGPLAGGWLTVGRG